jgi:hypothetical protein
LYVTLDIFWNEEIDKSIFGKTDEKKERLVKLLFKPFVSKKKQYLKTNFTRIRLHLKQFRKYSKFKNKFEIEFKIEEKLKKGFILFQDRAFYIYKESRYYYKDEKNFKHLIFLIRFDEFSCFPNFESEE